MAEKTATAAMPAKAAAMLQKVKNCAIVRHTNLPRL
jgi:hypothetical protein